VSFTAALESTLSMLAEDLKLTKLRLIKERIVLREDVDILEVDQYVTQVKVGGDSRTCPCYLCPTNLCSKLATLVAEIGARNSGFSDRQEHAAGELGIDGEETATDYCQENRQPLAMTKKITNAEVQARFCERMWVNLGAGRLC
jgi:hypothetical protein